MNKNEENIANALSAIDHEINGNKIQFRGRAFRLFDNDNVIDGTFHISTVDNHYRLVTDPSIGVFDIAISLIPVE